MPTHIPNYIVSIALQSSLAEASEKMRAEGIHHLLVVDDGRAAGLLSDRDTLDAWIRSGGIELDNLKVEGAYRKDIPTIDLATSVKDAVTLMQQQYTDALLVRLDDGVGVITTMDLLNSLTEEKEPSGFDFARLTFADPLLQKIMKTLSDVGI